MNAEDICQFFEWFEHAQTEHKIEAVDIWNMNESDFQVGVGCGQWMIISVVKDQGQDKRVRYQFTHLIDSVESTKHITVIETISAEAVTIDFFIIIKRSVIQL